MEDSSEKRTQEIMHMQHMHISIIMLTVIVDFFMLPFSFSLVTYFFDRLIISPQAYLVNR